MDYCICLTIPYHTIPYHAAKLYAEYKVHVGYGIISLQGKESKHAGVKHDLALTNWLKSTSSLGKWSQVMTANYARAFYLPKQHPAPSSYISHYESRLPPHIKYASSCECGWEKNSENLECLFCEGCKDVLQCLELQQLSEDVLEVLKPVCCPSCNERFADDTYCGLHMKSEVSNIDARKLTVKQ